MTTKDATIPTREASEEAYRLMTLAERMETDIAAQRVLQDELEEYDILTGMVHRGVKGHKARPQFSVHDAREVVFALAVWVHGFDKLAGRVSTPYNKLHIGGVVEIVWSQRDTEG